MDRVVDLRADYDVLGRLLLVAEGSAAAALARERRIIGELLDGLEKPAEVPVVDKLASNVVALAPSRKSVSKAARSSA